MEEAVALMQFNLLAHNWRGARKVLFYLPEMGGRVDCVSKICQVVPFADLCGCRLVVEGSFCGTWL